MRNFLVANAVYWLEEFHVDGLRVDAVASMLYLDYSRKDGEWAPNKYGGRENLEAIAFLQEVNATCYKRVPGIIMIAEESTAWPGVSRPVYLGGLGFGFKWNMGWMHDTLDYLSQDPIYRQYHHNEMTFSHDVRVLGELRPAAVARRGGARQGLAAAARCRATNGAGSPGCARCWRTCGPTRASSCCSWGRNSARAASGPQTDGLDWWVLDYGDHRGVQRLSRDLNAVYRELPGAVGAGLRSRRVRLDRLQRRARQRAVLPAAFGRARHRTADRALACVANFSAMPHQDYRVGLPHAGRWREVLNTDAAVYGGSGVGNLGGIEAVPSPGTAARPRPRITLPPLGVLWLSPDQEGPA